MEIRLAQLAAAVGPLRRVLAAIAARCAASRVFEQLGFARVHRALAGLPALERALIENALLWSKVRLLARVATSEDEASWIAWARVRSARVLEHAVRASAQGNAPPEEAGATDRAGPQRRVALRCTDAVREKCAAVREVAERVAGESLHAGEVLELVLAEAFSASSIDPVLAAQWEPSPTAPATPVRPAEGSEPTHSGPPPPARVLPRAVVALAAGLEEADAFELDRRLCQAVRLEQSLEAAIAPLLRIVRCADYEWSGPYRALPDYVRDELGMSLRKARALLRLERAGDLCPELRAAYRQGRLSWVKAQCLLPLLTLDLEGEWRPAWVAWAEGTTVRRLARDVERALLLRAGHSFAWHRSKFHPERAQDPIPPDERQLCAPDVDPEATQELVWRVPIDVANLFVATRETWRARLEAGYGRPVHDGEVFDALLDHALAVWTLREPGARRPDPVIERDGYRCAVPGCTSRRNLHDHHIVFRSAGGSDEPGNRVTLCAFHHQRGVHGGLVRVLGHAPDDLLFELGLRPGSPPLARYRSGDLAVPFGESTLERSRAA